MVLERISIQQRWRSVCFLLLGCVLASHPKHAQAFDINAQVPTGNEDFSAFRTDCEVVGWSKDYTELAMGVIEVARDRRGEQLGEFLLMVYKVGALEPFQSSHHLLVTQEARPFDPAPLETAEDRMYGVGSHAEKIWSRTPIKSRPRGAMHTETLWAPHEIEPGICAPSLGYVLRHKGHVRYQMHQLLKMRAKCAVLKLGEEKWRWAKNDLAVDMIRFDYNVNPENEFTIRFPISVAWHLAKPVTITLRTTYAANHPTVQKVKRQAAKYGRVQIEYTKTPLVSAIRHNIAMAQLAKLLGSNLNITSKTDTRLADHTLAIDIGPLASATVAPQPMVEDKAPHPVETIAPPSLENKYLHDWQP